MIVTYTEEGWQIVTQRAHGMLAAQLAMQWRSKDRPERWVETLLAIAEHDDAEVELDGENLLTEQGGPLNFNMKVFDLAHCQKLAALSITKSRYIALLTSMHMEFLYQAEAPAAGFLRGQKKLRDNWRRELGLTKAACEKIYALLEWCDAMSLLLCQDQVQPEHRSIEISTGPDKNKFQLVAIKDEQLTIAPWPFEIPSFEVHFEKRLISQLQFKSSADFRKAFYEAPVTEVKWTLVKAKPPAEKNKSKA
ncbi:MAG: DUF3891 family protein [Ginsengibacter sp.]